MNDRVWGFFHYPPPVTTQKNSIQWNIYDIFMFFYVVQKVLI